MMTLGEKIKAARLEAGLSQRQLCGSEVTRNMLSQIENGSAQPSMKTLSYFAAQLGKPVSYFLEEDAVCSPNQTLMAEARAALAAGDGAEVARLLEHYRSPDPTFDAEARLVGRLGVLQQAASALEQNQGSYAARLLEELGEVRDGYCAEELERRRLLLLAAARPSLGREIVKSLLPLDEELLLRARVALEEKNFDRCAKLLEAAQDRSSTRWNFLRGEVYLARGQYGEAARHYHRAEAEEPRICAERLERCYRELGDFKQAYFYACRQR